MYVARIFNNKVAQNLVKTSRKLRNTFMTCNVNPQLKIALFGNHFPSPKCEKKMLFTFYILQFKLYGRSL